MFRISTVFFFIFLLWISYVIYSYHTFTIHNQNSVYNMALMTAKESVRKDVILRRWISSVGGIYISQEKVKPNPYLTVPKRDVVTNYGDNLTLVNPAYTIRLLSEFEKDVMGWQTTHITGLKTVNPKNAPSKWEKEALESFINKGMEDYQSLVNEDNKTLFRYMVPLITYKECLKCHGDSGFKLGGIAYKEGDIRGGISIVLDYTPFLAINKDLNKLALRNHIIFGVIGSIVLLVLSIIIIGNLKNLSRQKEKFKTVFDEAPVGIFIYDREGNLIEVNNKILDIMGLDLNSVKSVNLFELKDPEMIAQIRSSFEKEAGYYEGWYKANKSRYLKCSFKLMPGSTSRGIAVVEDLTENKIAEDEKIKMQEQLFQTQKMESIGVISGGIAHDFNNILTVIITYCQILLSKISDNLEIKVYAERIIEAVDKAKELTNKLLLFSRKRIENKSVVNPNEIIQGFYKMLKRVIPEDIVIELKLSKDIHNILIDPVQFEQILMNLVVNARDAIKNNGRIVIETKNVVIGKEYTKTHYGVEPGEYVLMAVSDTGSGIEKDIITKIFDPFFTTKEVGKGSGMGLATVYSIVKQAGGYINVYSEPGFGTTFRLYFPASKDKTPEIEKASMEKDVDYTPGRRPDILFVDDEKGIGEGYLKLLQDNGFKVYYVNDPIDGINAVKNGNFIPELLVSDVVMPKLNGIELANELKKLVPDLKTIFISGYPDEIIRERGISAESINLIRKPFRVEELIKKINELYKERNG